MSGTHSKYSPSSADRWGNCYASIALTEAAGLTDDETSEHAASGTFTHSIAERLLKNPDMDAQSFMGVVETHDGFTFKCDQDRIDRALFYVDFIRARPGEHYYEVKLDHSSVIGVPDQSGTADCVIANVETHTLEIHDLKDGQGAVPITTYQLVVYALAARLEFAYLDDFLEFRVFIHQPRLNLHDEHSYTRDELGALALKLYKAAQRSEEVTKLSNNKILAAATPGDLQCKWCRVKGSCPARAQAVAKYADIMPVAQRALALTNEQIAEVLDRGKMIRDFLDSVFAEATRRAKEGQTIDGWQLSRGREGNRKWLLASEEAVGEELYEILEHEAYTRELISPAVAEKKLKKAKAHDLWAKLQDFIERNEAGITLVPAASGKPAEKVGLIEFADLTEVSVDDLL